MGALGSVRFFFFSDCTSIYQVPPTSERPATLSNISLNAHSKTSGDFGDSNGNYSPRFLNTGCHLLRVTWLIKGRDESQCKLLMPHILCMFCDTPQPVS